MSEDRTPYTTAADSGTPAIADTVGTLLTRPCPHCQQPLRLLISDDGRLLFLGALDASDEPDADSE